MGKKSSLGFMDGRPPTRNHDHGGFREGRGGSHDATPSDNMRSRPSAPNHSKGGVHIGGGAGSRTIHKSPIKRYIAG